MTWTAPKTLPDSQENRIENALSGIPISVWSDMRVTKMHARHLQGGSEVDGVVVAELYRTEAGTLFLAGEICGDQPREHEVECGKYPQPHIVMSYLYQGGVVAVDAYEALHPPCGRHHISKPAPDAVYGISGPGEAREKEE